MRKIGIPASRYMNSTKYEKTNRFWCYTILVPVEGQGAHLALMLSETPVQEHPRPHLDLFAGDAPDQAAEVKRLISLGAERVEWDMYPDDAAFIVLADTEGNRFCLTDISR